MPKSKIVDKSKTRKYFRKVDKITKKELRKGILESGKLYSFRYVAKGFQEGTLDEYDASPLTIVLDIYTKQRKSDKKTVSYMLGINLHWLNKNQKKKIWQYLNEKYFDAATRITKRSTYQKIRKFQLLYSHIKSDATLKPILANNALRLYIIKRMSTVKVIPMKFYPLMFTTSAESLKARFVKQPKGK